MISEECIRRLGNRVFFVYLWDLAPGFRREQGWHCAPGEEVMPGDGQIDFRPIFRALKDVRYAGVLNYFHHHTGNWPLEHTNEAIRRSLAYVRAELAATAG